MFEAFVERIPWTSAPAPGFLSRAWSRITTDVGVVSERLRRAQCGFIGHAMVLHLERQRMSLRCLHCGQQTPGWTVDAHR